MKHDVATRLKWWYNFHLREVGQPLLILFFFAVLCSHRNIKNIDFKPVSRLDVNRIMKNLKERRTEREDEFGVHETARKQVKISQVFKRAVFIFLTRVSKDSRNLFLSLTSFCEHWCKLTLNKCKMKVNPNYSFSAISLILKREREKWLFSGISPSSTFYPLWVDFWNGLSRT